jgi:hypothetical protein
MKFVKYSYKSGEDVIAQQVVERIETVLCDVKRPLKRYSAPLVRQDILMPLRDTAGWSDQIRISSKRGLTLTAKNGLTALCLQTGNMARFYADILKLQAQFLDGKITSGIYILPAREAAQTMGENMVNFERLTTELSTTFSKVITIPLVIYGFYSD